MRRRLMTAVAAVVLGVGGTLAVATASNAALSTIPNGQYLFKVTDPATGAVLESTVTKSVTIDGKDQVCETRRLVKGMSKLVIGTTCTVNQPYSSTWR